MKKFEKHTGQKKMWALRLDESALTKLAEIAKNSGGTKTEVIRFLIDEYHAEHVAKKGKHK